MSELTLALTALTGGGTGALDKIDGAGLSDGHAAVVVLSTGVYHYHLNATSGASENSPYIISPDTNAGTKRWVLVVPKGPMSHVEANRNSVQSIPNSTDTVVLIDDEVRDDLSEYNPTTGIFTALYAGRYAVSCTVLSSQAIWPTNSFYQVSVAVNGVIVKKGQRTAISSDSSYYLSSVLSTSITVSVGDTIRFQVKHTQGGALNTTASPESFYCSIDRLP